jgi:hypothetical protein
MKFLDFEFDGLNLSDFGFIACRFDAASGIQTVSAGSKLSFTKISRDHGRKFSMVNAEYSECLTASFDICKDPDKYPTQPEQIITNDEYRDIMRWLNRRTFCTFRIIPDACLEEEFVDTCRFNASCNVEKIKLAEDLIGLRLTFETDKPFGYGEKFQKTAEFSDLTPSHSFLDYSDEVGEIYPDLQITVSVDGDLQLSNDTLGGTMIVRNCTAGEVITIYGKEQIILSSVASHDISNDFNYDFLKIGNTYASRKNTITSTLPCSVTLSYMPIIKDTFV